MRSQLFGFVVQTQLIYEILLDCSLKQAVAVMKQHLVALGAIIPTQPATKSKLIHYLSEPLTIGFETYLNEWDEEVVKTVHAVTSRHRLSDEWLRMEELKRAISWLWSQFRETTVIGNFVFSTTIEEKILLTVTLGWNSGAKPEAIALTDTFIPIYLKRLERLGHQHTIISFPVGLEKAIKRQPNYGPRLDTLDKLKELVSYRRKHMTQDEVNVTLKTACREVNLAMRTAKKYAPLLCNRWYDETYQGKVH